MSEGENKQLMITLGFASDVGLSRNRNEDSYSIFTPFPGESNPSQLDAVLNVADGMGGEVAGELASRLATERIREWFSTSHYLSWPGLFEGETDPLEIALRRAFLRINREIYNLSVEKPNLKGLGTTLVVALVKEQKAYIAHIGDSRCYLIRNGTIERLTTDHSWVERQIQEGLITPEEALTHPQRNIITKSMGLKEGQEPDIRILPLEIGDQLLLCTDGLCGHIADHLILEAVMAGANPQEACKNLVALGNKLDGTDNITVVIGCINEYHQPDTKPDIAPVCQEPSGSRLRSLIWTLVGFMIGVIITVAVAFTFEISFSAFSHQTNPSLIAYPSLLEGMQLLDDGKPDQALGKFQKVLEIFHNDQIYAGAYQGLNECNLKLKKTEVMKPTSMPSVTVGAVQSTSTPQPSVSPVPTVKPNTNRNPD